MNKRNRLLGLLLALLLMLTSCSLVPAPTFPAGDAPGTESTPASSIDPSEDPITGPSELESNVVIQRLPEIVENPSNLPVLKWVVMTEYRFGGINQTRSENAVHELNQMLADRNMPFRIQFSILSLDTPNSNSDWFSRAEALKALADADLVWGNMVAEEMQEYLYPITEYVTGSAQPSLKNAVAHTLNWVNATVKGEIYGIPTGTDPAYCLGWEIAPAVLTQIGLTEKDFRHSFWEMDDVFAILYKRNGNEPFLYFGPDGTTTGSDRSGALPTTLPSMVNELKFTYQPAGACFVIDHSDDAPVVVNLLETNTSRNLQAAKQRYQDAGYVMTAEELHKTPEKLLLRHTVLEGNTEYTDAAGNRCIPITPSYYDAGNLGNYSGVTAVSQHKEEALQLLKLIAEDEAFRMQLCYGKEGRDYEIADGCYTIITQKDGSRYNLSILSMLDSFSGMMPSPQMNGFAGSLFTTQTCIHEGKTELETYRYNLDNIGYFYYPIIFDYTGFERELDAMEALYAEYFPDFLKTTEVEYSQMVQDMKVAGSDKIQTELQRQLDAWLAENPDWQ